MNTQIGPACASEQPEVLRLLDHNHLPIAGLLEHLGTTLVARQDGRIIGSAALEVYGDGALLRSVAIAPEFQQQGLGRELVDAALGLARQLDVPAVYLLTTTAERYFPKFGFERITREDVPAGVRASVEFTSACPSSAVVMRKTLSERSTS